METVKTTRKAKTHPNIKGHRQQQERPRQKPLLLHHLRDHRAHDPDIPIQRPAQGPPEHRRPKRAREAKPETPDPGAHKADQDHAFPAAEKGMFGVGETAPEDRSAELGAREGCGQESGLLGYDGVGGWLVVVRGPEAFELVVHVGLEACLGQGLREAGEGEDGELGFFGEGGPGDGAGLGVGFLRWCWRWRMYRFTLVFLRSAVSGSGK